jgi:DNA-binding NtrC family response regulator
MAKTGKCRSAPFKTGASANGVTLASHVFQRNKGEAMTIIDDDATLAEAVRTHIIRALAHCGGNRTHAAKTLDISVRCLRNKLREYTFAGIEVTRVQNKKSAESAHRGGSSLPTSSVRA